MNTETPRVSVIIPAYEAAAYITKAIRSVQAQTVCDWELIVLDDGSKDDTVQTVAALAQEDPRIRLYPNETNMGVAKTRNRGIALCRGRYVAFLDSDDAWYPEKLQVQLDCLQRTGADLVCSAYAIVDAQGEKICRDYRVPERIDLPVLLKENVIGCSTVMLTGETAKKYRFPEAFYHEDYVLWLEMLRSGCKMAGVDRVLVDYYFHPDSKAGNKQNSAGKRWQIYRKYLGLSFVKSAWYFAHYALAGLRKYKKV